MNASARAIARWRDQFLAGGRGAVRSRPADARDDEIARLRAKVGELTMENELLRDRARCGGPDPFQAPEVEAVSPAASPAVGRTNNCPADRSSRVRQPRAVPRPARHSDYPHPRHHPQRHLHACLHLPSAVAIHRERLVRCRCLAGVLDSAHP